MDARKERVLQAIIDDYIQTAEPVGSRTIARKYNLGVSPATIRNEMADLEEMGYLEQPHTSAGRVPSDKGYRYYVDCLIEPWPPERGELEGIRRQLVARVHRVEGIVRQAARLLAEATEVVALATTPPVSANTLAAVQVVPLRDGRALLLAVTDEGRVQSRVVELVRHHVPSDLERLSRVLTERLAGTVFGHVGAGQVRSLFQELAEYAEVLEATFEILAEPGSDRVVVGGTTNLFKQPEFHALDRVQAVLATIEDDELVEAVLGAPRADERGVGVAIGHEISVDPMRDCSVVSAVYSLGGRSVGRIGVLGPRRMDYSRTIALVAIVARGLSDLLTGESSAEPPGRSAS